MQSSWSAWHDTEGHACKEVKKPNVLLCILSEAFDQISSLADIFIDLKLLIFLIFPPYTKQTNFSSWSKRSPCHSWLVHNISKQIKNSENFSIIFHHFFFASLEKR